MDGPWRIRLLGGLRAERGEQVIERFHTRKTAGLFAYLALHPGQHAREALIEMLWPESPLPLARNSLSKSISWLRGALEPGRRRAGAALAASRTTLGLRDGAVVTDVAAFERALGEGRASPAGAHAPEASAARRAALERAVESYGGELCPGAYDEWLLPIRARLAEGLFDALLDLAAIARAEGAHERAIDFARRACALDPLAERASAALIESMLARGDAERALAAYREVADRLERELGVEPSADLARLAGAARKALAGRAAPPAAPAARPAASAAANAASAATAAAAVTVTAAAPSAPSAAPHASDGGGAGGGPEALALPRASAFFGREAELERVEALLLADGARLVTLTGPGGIGKTSLAEALVERIAGRAGAVALARLAETRDPRDLPRRVLDAIGAAAAAPGEREPGAQEVSSALAARAGSTERGAVLLVLDNLEHLHDAARALVRDLLAVAPAIPARILATSRRRLRLADEREVALAPLPTPRGSADPARLAALASVRLLVERGRRLRPDLVLDGANARALAALADRLEGIPLALALAGARLAVLSPGQLLERLESPGVLATRVPGAPARHRSLDAAIASSLDLLAPASRRLFARLSVFRGGFSLDAIAAVCADPLAERPEAVERASDLLDAVTDLVDASLLVAEAQAGEVRYRLLEALRRRAQAELPRAESEALERRHAAWFAARASEAEARLAGAEQARGLARVAADEPDLLAVLDRAGAAGGADGSAGRSGGESVGERDGASPAAGGRAVLAEPALRVAAALGASLWVRGRWREGLRRLDAALALPGGSDDARADALLHAANLALALGDLGGARARIERQHALRRRTAGPREVGRMALNLGTLAALQGDAAAARAHLEEASATQRAIDDGYGLALSLLGLGKLAYLDGDDAGAARLLEEALPLARGHTSARDQGACLVALAAAQRRLGEDDAARAHLEEARGRFAEAGEKHGLAPVLLGLGELEAKAGEAARAEAMFEEALAIEREVENPRGMEHLLGRLGDLAIGRDDLAGARRRWLERLGVLAAAAQAGEAEDGARARGAGASAESRPSAKAEVARRPPPPAPDAGPLAECFERLAALTWREGDRARAARLLGVAEQWAARRPPSAAPADPARGEADPAGAARVPDLQDPLVADLAALRRAALRAPLRAAREGGRALALDAARAIAASAGALGSAAGAFQDP